MIVLLTVLGVLLLFCGAYRIVCLRHRKPNRAADFDGFVFSQNAPPFNALRYGFFRASYNGCGVAAAVNASRILGIPVHPADVISDFERFGAVLFGLFGTASFAITHYFRKQGCRVKITYRRAAMERAAKAAPVSVLWYVHKRGAHFVTLQPQDDGFLAYNAGRRSAPLQIVSPEEFLAKRALLARMITILDS